MPLLYDSISRIWESKPPLEVKLNMHTALCSSGSEAIDMHDQNDFKHLKSWDIDLALPRPEESEKHFFPSHWIDF